MKFVFLVFFYESPNPGPTFFVYWKLLISLLNGAFFRLGDNFSVRGYGARFSATDHQQLFKQMVGTPYGFCCAAGLGKNNEKTENQEFGPPKSLPKSMSQKTSDFSEIIFRKMLCCTSADINFVLFCYSICCLSHTFLRVAVRMHFGSEKPTTIASKTRVEPFKNRCQKRAVLQLSLIHISEPTRPY